MAKQGRNQTNENRKQKIISFEEYCYNRMAKQYDYGFRIRNGIGIYFKGDREFTKEELDATHPTPNQIVFSEHAESKYMWMYQ